jgi:gamma-glutamyltranspeptidase/glutathione hydrolase
MKAKASVPSFISSEPTPGMTTPLAIATTSTIAAQAGESIARAGGNAVDAAIAATLVSINTEPGVCSLGCGGFMTVWPPGGDPVTLDGYVAAPGKNTSIKEADRNSTEVHLEYGGGVKTVVGPDSVGVPGGIALLGTASKHFGKLPWHCLFEPAIEIVRNGFPLPEASYNYLIYSGDSIFGRSPDGYGALHHPDGRLRRAGEIVQVPHLADTLERIAKKGPNEFYSGAIGRAIIQYSIAEGGRLSAEDMATYEVIHRPSLIVSSRNWKIATNPPPAVGGAVLAAMLKMISAHAITDWNLESVQFLIEVQRAALGYRRDRLDLSEHITEDAARLLELAASEHPAALLGSGSTCHTSVVDDTGLACSVTTSAGYGAGDMPPDTGIWLNNCVGELELNKRGMNIGPPGIRLPSNMAPSAAVSDEGEVMAIGSPGADRITTALLQALVNYIMLDMPLADAIEYPRVHVELGEDDYRVAYESGVPVDQLNVPARKFDSTSMFFGGVGAAQWSPAGGFTVAADPRRNGGTWSPSHQK